MAGAGRRDADAGPGCAACWRARQVPFRGDAASRRLMSAASADRSTRACAGRGAPGNPAYGGTVAAAGAWYPGEWTASSTGGPPAPPWMGGGRACLQASARQALCRGTDCVGGDFRLPVWRQPAAMALTPGAGDIAATAEHPRLRVVGIVDDYRSDSGYCPAAATAHGLLMYRPGLHVAAAAKHFRLRVVGVVDDCRRVGWNGPTAA
jgi:hypothetical protein